MKKSILSILAAALTVAAAAPTAEAGSYRRTSTYCAPYKVSTCEVSRCNYRRAAYDHCGYRYSYTVTAVTYRDHYSDGSSRTYTRTFRS